MNFFFVLAVAPLGTIQNFPQLKQKIFKGRLQKVKLITSVFK